MHVPDQADGPEVVEKSKTGKVAMIAGIAALGGFLFGYDSSVINGANQAVFAYFDIPSGFIQGFVVSIALLGSALGAFFGGAIADRYGRKRVMLVAAVMFLVSGIGTGVPFGQADFMFWRFFGGIAIGLAAVVSPMYISEIAPAHLRGRLSSLFQLAIVVGIFSTQLVNQLILVVARADDGTLSASNSLGPLQAWQWMFLLMVVPAVVYGLLVTTLPESPRYLVSAGKLSEAEAVLDQVLFGDNSVKVASIAASVETDHKPSMRDIRGPRFGLAPIVWIGITLAILQQFVGINAVFYYSNLIWSAVGFGASQAFTTSTITSLVNLVFTLVAIAFVDRLGRKPLLLIGSVGMATALAVLTITFSTAEVCTEAALGVSGCMTPSEIGTPILSEGSGRVAVVAMMVYVAFFAATWGPVMWVMLGEMFSNTIRAAALSVAVMANWLANFAVSTAFPELVKASLGLAYGLFTLFAFGSIFFVSRYLHETKGAELEAMDALESAPAK
jgi:MFS transporter, SP family, sugar:H+ symporter